MTVNVPEGFKKFEGHVGFVELTGPLWINRTDDGAYLGLRVEDKHCNIGGICHGGVLMYLADMQLGVGAQAASEVRKFLPTVQMSCDFVSPVSNGAWLEGRTQLIKQTRNLMFATCILTVDGKNAFSGSGIMKIPSDKGSYSDVALPQQR
ncbi:PaaI family thioesterase [uncultured Sneathiella sp.]|uniref:PaaI family thioesterase n=1 Tax=uncultured Sneathiella sp. TaxID=879315 RepID=UPI0025980ED4|nr:PaaI family thioesterase [uncultured Sneathiella sp.]